MSTSDAPTLYAGVDVGEGLIHASLVRVHGGRCSFASRYSGDPGGLAEFCSGARRVGVDAPGGLSAGAHLADLSVAPKFRRGRCSEVPVPGVPAVPWVTPASWAEAPGWMRTGFAVWTLLHGAGLEAVETFPAAFFHRINCGRWPPPKTSAGGRAARLSLLAGLVDLPDACQAWGHDDIDAVACAAVAALGAPAHHVCDRPDGSVMWLLPAGVTR
ncbi:MAG TPA: DUF429 domain-containing protein [Acidimicrobiales bacterium]|nr:DUF429 domain-containing protein [Acidimicrobiales bacterium]